MASQAFRPTVEFDPNKPQVVALKFAGAGKMVTTRYGDRVMFTLVDERVMFLDLGVAQRINELGINVREPFSITKEWSGRRGDPINWVVERLQQQLPTPDPGDKLQEQLHDSVVLARSRRLGEQGDGTFAVGSSSPTNGAAALAPTRKPVESAPAARMWSDVLLADANALTDVYMAAWDYAKRYQGAVKPEEVKSFVITAYINVRKMAGSSH